jgi:hypothetical protein
MSTTVEGPELLGTMATFSAMAEKPPPPATRSLSAGREPSLPGMGEFGEFGLAWVNLENLV